MDFASGMTAITGETGAGKSLTLDALSMALGDRADSDRIRQGANRAEVSARFEVAGLAEAKQWLAEHDFESEDECLLRRVFSRDGRSRGYINGQPATMQQLQQFGELLIDIHSQHEHQSLLRRDTHRVLLDAFGGHQALAEQTSSAYQDWRQCQKQLEQLSSQSSELNARRDLLSFQVQELDELDLKADELEDLEQQQKLLANAEHVLTDTHRLLSLCSEDDHFSLLSGLSQACSLIGTIPGKQSALLEVEEMLTSAKIQVEEASNNLRHYVDSVELDPERLQEVEERLSLIYQQARKHRIEPEALLVLHQQLQAELAELSGGEQDLETLAKQAETLRGQYQATASELTEKRSHTANKLAKAVNDYFPDLAMKGAELKVSLTPANPSLHGNESVEFVVCTNSGQPHKPLSKVASGGELSRISLAIQVATAKVNTKPTLVFDEVDVGIGGSTAAVVGKLLRELGNQGQVICVTHLPQVASCAHHHWQVSKASSKKATHTKLLVLEQDHRVEEIARMLGGMTITDQTRTHAREMLELSDS